MKSKFAHAFAGFSIGLVCYAVYLLGFMYISPLPRVYWLLPVLNQSLASHLASQLSMVWEYQRFEAMVILLGLAFPSVLAAFAWLRSEKASLPWLRRWPIQIAFIVTDLVAAVVIMECIRFIL